MADFIRFQKIASDAESMELNVSAQNPVISASSKIYVTVSMLQELQEQILAFLAENDLEAYWENDVPGCGGPPCVTMTILPHGLNVLVEIYMELNDGGSFMDHHCLFYVCTDRPALKYFSQKLSEFVTAPPGAELMLNG